MSRMAVSNGPGILYIVATPLGHLGDLTHRAEAVLREVDRILAEDTRHTRRLLEHYGIATPMTAFHEHNERAQQEQALRWLEAGQSLALVSDAGTPLVSDPGFPLVRTCRARGIRVSPVPGPSALVAALSVSGLPVDRFCFQGFLPRQAGARRERIRELARTPATLVFYESAHRIEAALADLCRLLGPERRGVLARELTKRHEEVLQGTVCRLAEQVAADPDRRKGEFVILVAPPEPDGDAIPAETRRVLQLLLEELPLKQAAALAARITGEKKNRLYRLALDWQGSLRCRADRPDDGPL